MKSASLLVSEVCRAWMENDANGMVAVAGSVIPDFAISDGGTQAKCDRLLVNPGELGGAGENVDDEEIMTYCRSRLAGFKRPGSVVFIEALPRNQMGKVLKRELREKYGEL